MDSNTQNIHLEDHLPVKKSPLKFRLPGKPPPPLPPKRQTKVILFYCCLFIGALFLSLSGIWYFGMHDARLKQKLSSNMQFTQTSISKTPVRKLSGPPESIFAMPDLTSLLNLLNSDDPKTQELGYAPQTKPGSSGTPVSLPKGAKIEAKPDTWKVLNVDVNNEPLVGWVQALVTLRGEKNPRNYDLHLVKVDGHWLLYNTTER